MAEPVQKYDVHANQISVNGATALGYEATAGNIRVGKEANMIVIDQPLINTPVTDIGETKGSTTLFRGDVVCDATSGQ